MDLKRYQISKLEGRVLNWLIIRRFNTLIFIVLFITLNLLPSLPYLNLFITRSLIIFLVICSLFIVFNISVLKIIIFSFLFFLFSLAFYLVREPEYAELLGNYVYGFLFIGVISFMLRSAFELRSATKEHNE